MNDREDLAAWQIRKNAQVRGNRELFAAHRRRVTELLRDGPRHGRCCILGAGNCLDLDLPQLLAVFDELHLVDIDGDAMRCGVEEQGCGNESRISLHGGIDLSNLATLFDGERSDADLDVAIARAERVPAAPLPGPFDVVASVCLLSQLLEISTELPGASHSRYLQTVQAIRRGHLRLIGDLLAPAGTGLLITDLVSSDTCPTLESVPPEQLPWLCRQLVEAGNFFTGLNPAVLHSMVTSDPEFSGMLGGVQMIEPWLWDLGPRRYAVYAIRFRRSG